MSQEILPLAVWESGTNNNSIPANDNALRVEVALKEALSIANSEPGSPSERDLHIVGTSWGGFTTNNAVIYLGGTWYEFEAFDGWFKTIAGDLYNFDGVSWNLVTGGGGGSETLSIITEASSFTAVPATHAGLSRYIRAGGDVTFDDGEGYSAGQVFNIRSISRINLIGEGVELTPPFGGSLVMEPGTKAQVVMTSGTTADVNGWLGEEAPVVYTYEVFTEDGNFDTPDGIEAVDVLIVAGGGGGARGGSSNAGGAGGGAGGVRFITGVAVNGEVPVTIGQGGAGGNSGAGPSKGQDGGNSSFGTLVAVGGSGGAYNDEPSGTGGSGGGAITGHPSGFGEGTGGQGNDGGTSAGSGSGGSGGGGGFSGPGVSGTSSTSGDGGSGVTLNDLGWGAAIGQGAPLAIAGGGGAGRSSGTSAPGTGTHGAGSGGNASQGGHADENTGSGGGGGGIGPSEGGSGADGIVIVRYASGLEPIPNSITQSIWIGHSE